ncbi:MAG: glycosyltransferase [Brachybacterium sp.]|nr:glycosyltransferase [Brachybacterium sp.]
MLALARWRLRNRRIPLWCNGLVPALATTGVGPRLVHLHGVPSARQRAALAVARLRSRAVVVPSRYLASIVDGSTVLPNWTGPCDVDVRLTRHSSAGPLRVGFLGRLTAAKGAAVLAHSLQTVAERRRHDGASRDITLVVAGTPRFTDPSDADGMEAALMELDLPVERLGWVDRHAFFDQVDLAVFPSIAPETFGLVAAEAMAARIPFVISDAGALPEVAGPDHPWIARAGDHDDLAAVLCNALYAVENGSAALHADNAHRRWEAMFSPPAGRERIARLMHSMGRSQP